MRSQGVQKRSTRPKLRIRDEIERGKSLSEVLKLEIVGEEIVASRLHNCLHLADIDQF